MTEVAQRSNEYWEKVRPYVDLNGGRLSRWGAGNVYELRWWPTEDHGDDYPDRHELVKRYSWTVTDPTTVEFVVKHAGSKVIDPLAGNGWWPYLLYVNGVADVIASDIAPAGAGGNRYTHDVEWYRVRQGDAAMMVCQPAIADYTLLLSWPPYNNCIGEDVVRGYVGNKIIYIGEDWGGCCGTDEMFDALKECWHHVDLHEPIQWDGIHDSVRVYERRAIVGKQVPRAIAA